MALSLGRTLAAMTFLGIAACSASDDPDRLKGGTTEGTDAAADAGIPFEAVPPRAYVAKVKTLLTGLAPTDEEVAVVEQDPSKLAGLVDGWIRQPEGEASIFAFFQSAFQQVQIDGNSFYDQLNYLARNSFKGGMPVGAIMLQQFQESFARTAWQLAMVEGKPFNTLFSTKSFMMTPALVVAMLFFERDSGDGYYPSSIYDELWGAELANMIVTDQGAIPIEQTLDPKSPNYLHWYDGGAKLPCGPKKLFPTNAKNYTTALFHLFLGSWVVGNGNIGPVIDATDACIPKAAGPMLFDDSDIHEWRMVSFRQVDEGELPTRMWDLKTIRASTRDIPIPIRSQRVGPFTTPAFFANWPSNVNNQARGTMNQALIVALGASFDGSNVVAQSGLETNDTLASSDAAHARDPSCQGCHNALDPMRQFITRTFNPWYGVTNKPEDKAKLGSFDFFGNKTEGTSLYDLGRIFQDHPLLPGAWVQKLCFWANSAACSEDDPAFTALADGFKANNYDFRRLLVDFLSSPLVTGAAPTATAQASGELVSISRLDHFCMALQNRLGIKNVCSVTATAVSVSLSIPTDSYTRGAVEPFQPTDPGLITRAATENLCIEIASSVVDVTTGPSRYTSADPNAAILDMVSNVMALTPKDPRYADAVQILKGHYADALAAQQTPTDALESTFTLACTSPSSVSIGL
ncbi:hypothetical protein AKJ09_05450 [Labilithrix luteola]|uniref:Cellulose-binding domain protein n=1 Tax=Labilithrix luteola TaxID=1391654 RepID=A0A0K1PZI2_9BACT|nr:hypothetical protein [Labilithrix luteola]AKU98786.1 hypothetical protein AKJ09_05450 [Labilithrix luteola]